MDEAEIKDPPSSQFDLSSLGKAIYEEVAHPDDALQSLYKQYTVRL